MPNDKLGHEIKEGDTVAFIYHGSGADLKIGKVITLKVCTRNRIKDLWAYCQIIGVDDKEYEGAQWCLPKKMLKLNPDMLDDVMLAKLSTEPGKKENLDMLPMELINKIKQEFKDRGYQANYRCKNFKQYIKVEMVACDWRQPTEVVRRGRAKRDVVIEEVFKSVGLNIEKSKWSSHYSYSIHVNP